MKLLPCPFGGCEVGVATNRDWHRIRGLHDEHCFIVDSDCAFPATKEALEYLIDIWNTRKTPMKQQPETDAIDR